jgi:hypothetical protein
MLLRRPVLALLLALLLALPLALPLCAQAKQPRSAAVKAEFQRLNPCPSTGERRGACPGWTKDHVIALACAKTPEERKLLDVSQNLQWQTTAEARAKDKWERKECGK